MTPFTRFLAFEAVGWVAAAAVLVWLQRAGHVSLPWAGVLFAIWVVKDFALYPLTRRAYEDGHTHGAAELLGREVRVETTLEPEGWVLAGSERWGARLAPGRCESIQVGQHVRVCGLQGLTLIVEPVEPVEPVQQDESSEEMATGEPIESSVASSTTP